MGYGYWVYRWVGVNRDGFWVYIERDRGFGAEFLFLSACFLALIFVFEDWGYEMDKYIGWMGDMHTILHNGYRYLYTYLLDLS